MHIVRRGAVVPAKLGVLAGSFNPPTRAHLALIQAAVRHVDEVICVLPRIFPHKLYHGATLDQRVAMLRAMSERDIPTAIGISDGGLFIDIARELRDVYPGAELCFLCGRDAAERIVEWDYGTPEALEKMLQEFSLLVAARHGDYEPPAAVSHRFAPLPLCENIDDISATSVRQAIERGEPWEHLVPDAIVDLVREYYTPR